MDENKEKPNLNEAKPILTDEEFALQMEKEFKASDLGLDPMAKARIWQNLNAKIFSRSGNFFRKPQMIPIIGLAAAFLLLTYLKPFFDAKVDESTRLKGQQSGFLDTKITALGLLPKYNEFEASDIDAESEAYLLRPSELVGFAVESASKVFVALYWSSGQGAKMKRIFVSGPLQGVDVQVGKNERPFSFASTEAGREFRICSLISGEPSTFPKVLAIDDKILNEGKCFQFRSR